MISHLNGVFKNKSLLDIALAQHGIYPLNMNLIVAPLKKEFKALVNGIQSLGYTAQESQTGRLPYVEFPALNLVCSIGGHGKSQFAVQTQHLINFFKDTKRVICAGTGGGLVKSIKPFDVVVGTKTIEYDIKDKLLKSKLPEFEGCKETLALIESKEKKYSEFNIHFGPIASGDENITEAERANEIHNQTQAIIVAWEGAGGARASQFQALPFLEIRAATDLADENTFSDFNANLERAMFNLSLVVTRAFV